MKITDNEKRDVIKYLEVGKPLPDKYRFIFQLNPMAVIINAYRQVILGGGVPKYSSLIYCSSCLSYYFIYWLSYFKSREKICTRAIYINDHQIQ